MPLSPKGELGLLVYNLFVAFYISTLLNNGIKYPDASGRRNDDAMKNKCPFQKLTLIN
jgi:hypothetical protein